jgi:hypothetical protein
LGFLGLEIFFNGKRHGLGPQVVDQRRAWSMVN